MLYRTAGQFKTSYIADQALFPVKQDAFLLTIILICGWIIFPLTASEFTFQTLLIPILIYALAAMGLNILTGFAGQLSLGTGAFMGVGAYACYKLVTIFPWMNPIIAILLSGVFSAGIGVAFGIPSLRIKGFYLAVATLAAQFFLVWLFNRVPWFYNYSASGQINAPERDVFGILITGPNAPAWATYLFCLIFLTFSAIIARNLTRGTMGRTWMAIRDMDIAAEIIGVNPLKAKLTAFAVSSFFVGSSGALFFALYLGAVEVGEVFGIQKSFIVLFMVIIGGLGSIFGSFAGAAFLVLLPVVLKVVGADMLGWPTDIVAHLQLVIVGAMIIIFLIMEPHGLAQLWRVAKEKLRLWPFPH